MGDDWYGEKKENGAAAECAPTLFIDGQEYEGALSLEQLTALIEARLK